jgi:hypothetical protein
MKMFGGLWLWNVRGIALRLTHFLLAEGLCIVLLRNSDNNDSVSIWGRLMDIWGLKPEWQVGVDWRLLWPGGRAGVWIRHNIPCILHRLAIGGNTVTRFWKTRHFSMQCRISECTERDIHAPYTCSWHVDYTLIYVKYSALIFLNYSVGNGVKWS